jgi:hypothetical protein
LTVSYLNSFCPVPRAAEVNVDEEEDVFCCHNSLVEKSQLIHSWYSAKVALQSGLPDFSWSNIPKREKYVYQIRIKYTKWPENFKK